MAEELQKPTDAIAKHVEETRQKIIADTLYDPVQLVERVYQLWWHWADFSLFIVSPTIEVISPAIVHEPELIPQTEEHEFVYPIHDHGYKLTTSKAQDMYTAGMSMCKLFYTIEKMMAILVERLKTGGVDAETEVQVAFGGHLIAQRKAFEIVINLKENVVVTNFDSGEWGERFLQNIKRLSDKGYGFPPTAPRTSYKQQHGPVPSMRGR